MSGGKGGDRKCSRCGRSRLSQESDDDMRALGKLDAQRDMILRGGANPKGYKKKNAKQS